MSLRAAYAAACFAAGLFATGPVTTACSDTKSSDAPTLAGLELSSAGLEPPFSPEVTDYRADVGLLASSVELHATAADEASSIRLNEGRVVAGRLSQELPLNLGENQVHLTVGSPERGTRTYSLSIERLARPWQRVEELTAEPPVEDGYFGDYLRASSDWLYVNASRRGSLYRRDGNAWQFDRWSEALFSVSLEWMFEAALSDDALAIVAQPSAGTETLFAFTLEAGDWVPAGEFEVGTQGTLRLFGDDLVFVASAGVSFFRREDGRFALLQTVPAPLDDIGFGERPTYFDAPGVDLGEDVLIVGAPRDSSPATGVDGDLEQDCSENGESCAFRSGAVFVYERIADEAAPARWALSGYLKPPEVAEQLQFGAAAALGEDLIVVGCSREGGTVAGQSREASARACTVAGADCSPESGAVYLYHREGGTWRQGPMLKASTPRAYDYFGDTLLLSGDVLLVGAPGQDSAPEALLEDASREDSGGIFAFVREADGFRELGLFKLDGDQAPPFPFPATLESSRSQLLVASNEAPFREVGGESLANAGRVYYLY